MTFTKARKQLEALGFRFPKENKCMDGTIRWGFQTPEPYGTGKNEFHPSIRDVFFAGAKGGFYVTSHIKGKMRRFRCQTWNDVDIANIFGGGTTLQKAIDQFVSNFNTQNYNTRP